MSPPNSSAAAEPPDPPAPRVTGVDLRVRQDPRKVDAILAPCCLAVCVGMLLCFVTLFSGSPDVEEGGLATFGILSVIAAGWTAWAWRTRRRALREYILRDGDVICSDGFGERWREPAARYRYLCRFDKTVTTAASHGTSTYVVPSLRFEHELPERCFDIISNETADHGAPVTEICRRWAEATERPVWDSDQGVWRRADDLLRPLTESLAADRVAALVDFVGPTNPPPAGVRWTRDANTIRVRARISRAFAWLTPVVLVVAVGSHIEDGGSVGPNAGSIFLYVATALVAASSLLIGYELRVDAEAVSTHARGLGVPVLRRRVAIASLLRVFSGAEGVVLETADRRVCLPGLNRAAAEWIAGFLQGSVAGRT